MVPQGQSIASVRTPYSKVQLRTIMALIYVRTVRTSREISAPILQRNMGDKESAACERKVCPISEGLREHPRRGNRTRIQLQRRSVCTVQGRSTLGMRDRNWPMLDPLLHLSGGQFTHPAL
jgi:hypothetical protein